MKAAVKAFAQWNVLNGELLGLGLQMGAQMTTRAHLV